MWINCVWKIGMCEDNEVWRNTPHNKNFDSTSALRSNIRLPKCWYSRITRKCGSNTKKHDLNKLTSSKSKDYVTWQLLPLFFE